MRHITISLFFLLVFYYIGYIVGLNKNEKHIEIMPCERPAIEYVQLCLAKRDMFLDKLQSCKKIERNKYVDSANHYMQLLKMKTNKIEY